MQDKSNKETIVHLLTSLKIGGAERFTIDLAEYQKHCGYQPLIVSLGATDDPLIAVCKSLNLPYRVIQCNKAMRQIRLMQQFSKADILHIHSPSAMRAVSGILPLFKQKKIVYTRHGAAPLTKVKWRKAHIKVAPYVDYITFVSDEGRENFQSTHAWHDIPHIVLDNGINVDSFSAAINLPQLSSEKIALGMVGRMVDLKHQICLLRALAKLPLQMRQRFSVHFFGDGPCMQQLQSFQAENLQDMEICFHGSVSEREIIYSAFNILVLTSLTEGLSLAIIEAMASAHPVIATRVGGNPTLVKPGETGWLFEYDDSDTLAQILTALPEQIDTVQQLGSSAQAFIRENYSLQNTAKKYEQLYLT